MCFMNGTHNCLANALVHSVMRLSTDSLRARLSMGCSVLYLGLFFSLCSGIRVLRRGSCHSLTVYTEELTAFSLSMMSLKR